jgi:hypothetical protein
MAPDIRIGAFTITPLGETVDIEGDTTDGVASTGRGTLYEVTGDDRLRLTVRDTRWDNGERDVVATLRHDSPQRFDTLIERLRLPVAERGDSLYAELRHVRLKENGRGNLHAPGEAELDAGAGVSVAHALMQHGATAVGTRGELLGDEGRMRSRMGVRFPRDAELVPLVAFVCTRVAPVARGVAA